MDVALLDGYTVLDLTDLRGQFAGRLLADMGMRVIKVEPPGGDPVRRLGPFKDDQARPGGSLRFAFLNGGKQSVTLDLETADGRTLLKRLVESADVLLESFSPGYLAGLRLGYESLKQQNPGLVMASITGFGQSGPHAQYLAPDIVGMAMGGLMYISGDPSLPPVKAPETQSYYYTSVFAALGVLLALTRRDATGQGDYIDVSVQESIATQEHMIREAAFDGVAITRNGSQHKHAAPANIFPCRDGFAYLFILGPRDWERFLELWTDHPAELDADELKSPSRRRQHAGEINPLVEQFTRRHTKAELTTLLQSHGIPCLPVNSPADFLAEPQIRERGLFGPVHSDELGDYRSPQFPVMVDGARVSSAGPPPALGEYNGAIYGGSLGLSLNDLELLFARGVI
ncbi:MAG TPA: CoA transferase [Dehalococcoidia bacterium]|nr:CoA transferase [Dehalococcoidia bacterium]